MKKEARKFSALPSVLLLTIAIFCSFEVNVAKAYHSGTHEFVFNQANQILKNDGWTSISDFLSLLDPSDPNGRTYLEVMIAGSSDHDNILPPPIVGDSSCWEHYIDPTDHHGIGYMGINMKNAGQLCEERFTAALNDWVVDGNRHAAMYDLGWAVHLVQDPCVPQHAYPTWENGHSAYEDWVDSNKESFAVTTGGIYTFSSFPDSEYYSPAHYEGPYANHGFDWVDFNAHDSIKYWGSVNYASGWQTDDYFVETVHSLPNSISTTWVVTEYQASQIQIHFASIQMQPNFDYVKIYDANDNLIASFTGTQSNVWTPIVLGNTLKIKTTTDLSVQSWGYKTDTVKFYDTGEDLEGATAALLSRAQRTTAGFIKCFFDWVNACTLRFDATGLDSSAIGTVLTVDGVPVTASQIPYYLLVADDSVVNYSYHNVTSLTPGKNFILSDVTGSASPITVTHSVNITGNYIPRAPSSIHLESMQNNSATSNLGTIALAVTSHPASAIWIEPAAVDVAGKDIGDKFNITVWINTYLDTNNSAIFTWQMTMNFNASLLSVTRVGYTSGTTSEFFAGHSTIPVTPIITSSSASTGESLIGTDSRAPGNGSLCWVELELVSQPSNSTILSINNTDTFCLNGNLNEITTVKYNAFIGTGAGYELPSDPQLSFATYTVLYFPASGYMFDHWEATSGFAVSDINANPANITLSGLNGTLKAIYAYWRTYDINHDWIVDMKDVGIAAKAAFTDPQDALWNPIADITGPARLPDGKVNMMDIGLIARHFQERYS